MGATRVTESAFERWSKSHWNTFICARARSVHDVSLTNFNDFKIGGFFLPNAQLQSGSMRVHHLPFCHLHYENTPMQYTAIFHSCKNDNFQYFHIFAKNIYCGYSLEPPQ